MWNDNDITPKVLLEHIQAMGNGIRQDMKSMEDRIMNTMDGRFTEVDRRFDRVDQRFEKIEHRLDFLDAQVFLIRTQTTDINSRLKHVEIKQLPKIRKSIRRIKQEKTPAS